MDRIGVGLLGCGTVGTGVAKILAENREILQSRLGADLYLAAACDKEPAREKEIPLPRGRFFTDAEELLNDPDISVVVELIGGIEPAKTFITQALAAGKSVVTANKALLAHHGGEIAAAAQKGGGDLLFEAAVGGVMPVIKTLRESLAGNRILSMYGILNGTCNYILSKITFEGKTFDQALSEAQAAGYAEADPGLDVDGMDTAHKLAITASLAWGTPVDLDHIYVEGIRRITPLDIRMAGEFGYRVKLLAIAKRRRNSIECRVHPTMVPMDNLLSSVNGAMNAFMIHGDAAGEIVLYGQGAGRMPTGSAVVSDLVDVARNRLCRGAGCRVPILSTTPEQMRRLPVLPISDIVTRYYVRFSAADRPGVLSKLSGILGAHDISISSVHQKGRRATGPVSIVMLTHEAPESGMQQALEQIAGLDVITDKPMLIRIEDDNAQEE
ncbi:MAG: homoserine dehydrogenase [Deltaproteobacteria bacterium]|nr:homoserine dehydrogenase [Deltaproteobacteria bacterium]